MDRSELMRLLNVKPAAPKGPAGPAAKTTAATTPAKAKPRGDASAQALNNLDEWDLDQGQKLIRFNHRLRQTELPPAAVSDFFASYYRSDPEPAEACRDERRLEFVRTTLESPDYAALHRSTERDPVASELAATEMAEGFARLQKDDDRREQDAERRRREGKKVDPGREQAKDDAAVMTAAAACLGKAKDKVDEYVETREACGIGKEEGQPDKISPERLLKSFSRVKDDAMIREVFRRSGKYRRVAQSKQRQKVKHGYDDTVGVVMDGDVGRLLPQEMAMLATPEFELDAMRRLVERQSMCRQYRGIEPVGKGPIVGVFDGSASMEENGKIYDAKATALTLYWIARHERRWCVLVEFASAHQGNYIVLPPGKAKESEVLDWIGHFFRGGTEERIPFQVLPDEWWPEFVKQGMRRGKTDMVIVSDGEICISPETAAAFCEWKKREKVRSIGLLITGGGYGYYGRRGGAGGLAGVVDEYHAVSHLGVESAAMQNVLSI